MTDVMPEQAVERDELADGEPAGLAAWTRSTSS